MIIVAGAGNTMADKLSSKYKARLDVAIKLLKASPGAKVLVTGGVKTGRPTAEATRAAEYLTQQGIAANRIGKETKSGSTNANFNYGLPIAKQMGAKNIVVVSSYSHMRRCLAFAHAAIQKHGLNIGITGAEWYVDVDKLDATIEQAAEQARSVWPEMTAAIVRQLDSKWKVVVPIEDGRPFPLPAGYYFGPNLSARNKYSVSGYYWRSFKGKPDNTWLKLWQAEAKRQGFYHGSLDGFYGPATASAARALQAKRKIQVDGLIGKDTWSAVWK